MDYILGKPLNKIKKYIFLSAVLLGINAKAQELKTGTINRKALVGRHKLKLTDPQTAGPTQVGNGDFAYGFDITGMQTFNDQFTTMSHWGWHSTKPPKGFTADSFRKTLVATHGRMVGYDLPNPKQAELTQWLAGNPHRFNLGRIGLFLKKENGDMAKISDLQSPVQYLDLWTGVAESHFSIEGQGVKVTTICDPDKDIISFSIESGLIQKGRLGVFIEFPYASLAYFSNGSDYNKPKLHQTQLNPINRNSAMFNRKLDGTTYQVACRWTGAGSVKKQKDQRYAFYPGKNETSVAYVFAFSPSKITYPLPSFSSVKAKSMAHWPAFWKSGGGDGSL